jgi:hypothetical protein
MANDSIWLTGQQINFLMEKFQTDSPDVAVEMFVELLVAQKLDPMDLEKHVNRFMARENN